MQEETALIRKCDTDLDLQDSALQEVWIVQYEVSRVFDVFASATMAHKIHLRFKGSRVIYRKVIQ